jgi:hypothetical protein
MKEDRSKKTLVFNLNMTRLIALEDFNALTLCASCYYIVEICFFRQKVMEQSCRLLCVGLVTVQIGRITKLYYFSMVELAIKISDPSNGREPRLACSSCGQKLALAQHAFSPTSHCIHFTSIFGSSTLSPSYRNIYGEEFSLF